MWVLLLASLGIVEPRIASAIINTGDSIEWLCECKPHIALVEVRLRADVPAPAGRRNLKLPIARTIRILKGRPPQEAALGCWDGVRVRPGGSAQLLAFFDDDLEIAYAIALDDSESCGTWPAITADFRVLRARQAVLSAVEARLGRMRRRQPEPAQAGAPTAPRCLTVNVPDWTAADRALFEGSANLLHVPADSEYRGILIRNLGSRYASVRASTALYLAEYPGQETVAALKVLLTDSVTDSLVTFGSERRSRSVIVYYPVRQAAYLGLRILGVDVPKPEGYVDNPTIESVIRMNPADDQPTLFR